MSWDTDVNTEETLRNNPGAKLHSADRRGQGEFTAEHPTSRSAPRALRNVPQREGSEVMGQSGAAQACPPTSAGGEEPQTLGTGQSPDSLAAFYKSSLQWARNTTRDKSGPSLPQPENACSRGQQPFPTGKGPGDHQEQRQAAREPQRSWQSSRGNVESDTTGEGSNECGLQTASVLRTPVFIVAPITETPTIFFNVTKQKIRKKRPKLYRPNSASLKHHHVLTQFLRRCEEAAASAPLTTLLGDGHHGVVADQAGHEGQGTGPEIFNDRGHEGPGQSLLEGLASRSVLCFIAMRYDDVRYGLLCEAGGQNQSGVTPRSPGPPL